MADRTMKAGDTWPPLKGQASDDTGVLNLTTATSLEVILTSGSHVITGVPVAIWPAQTDDEGQWNWQYVWAAGDTDVAGDYTVELKVTWGPGKLETFPNSGAATLTIEAS